MLRMKRSKERSGCSLGDSNPCFHRERGIIPPCRAFRQPVFERIAEAKSAQTERSRRPRRGGGNRERQSPPAESHSGRDAHYRRRREENRANNVEYKVYDGPGPSKLSNLLAEAVDPLCRRDEHPGEHKRQ